MNRYLATICVLRVDQALGFLKESFVEDVGAELRQWVNRKPNHFGLQNTVLIQRNYNFVSIAQNEMQLGIDVKRLCIKLFGRMNFFFMHITRLIIIFIECFIIFQSVYAEFVTDPSAVQLNIFEALNVSIMVIKMNVLFS